MTVRTLRRTLHWRARFAGVSRPRESPANPGLREALRRTASTPALLALLGAVAGAIASPVYADVVELDTVPSGWKLENYPGGPVVVWSTGAPCNSGQLALPSSATADDINRFWSLVLSAMIAQQQLFVRYDTTTCIIASFGMY